MRIFFAVVLFLSCGSPIAAQRLSLLSQELPPNYVPDAATARCIAEAVWLPIYGENVYQNRPYTAVLVADSVWRVEGTLPKGCTKGGVPYIEIRKSDGRIIVVDHGK